MKKYHFYNDFCNFFLTGPEIRPFFIPPRLVPRGEGQV